MERALARTAYWTICSGDIRRCGMSRPSRGACAISQFWQNTQWNGQPIVEIEYASEPGSTWNSGFFSIGSRPAAATAP